MKNSIASFLQTFFTGLIKPDPRGRRPLPRGVILRFCLPFLRPGQAGGKIYNSTQKQHRPRRCCTGAGDGNRTHVTSLEGWSSTIELHPRTGAVDEARTRDLHLGKVALYQLSYYRMKETGETVRTKRLELLRRSAPDPKSGASAIPPRPQRTPRSRAGRESDPLEIRTPDTLIKSQVLCQLS